jgi:ribosomal protein S18 acetylase RimI-like enzyme
MFWQDRAMAALTLRPMTEPEFADFAARSAENVAGHQVTAGIWAREGAFERGREQLARSLPDGLRTRDMLLLTAMVAGVPVGLVWIGLTHPRGTPDTAFIYDIEVAEAHRGAGHGRALLAAAEEVARSHGLKAVTLNVHAHNERAVHLYETSGYRVVTQQMTKDLTA